MTTVTAYLKDIHGSDNPYEIKVGKTAVEEEIISAATRYVDTVKHSMNFTPSDAAKAAEGEVASYIKQLETVLDVHGKPLFDPHQLNVLKLNMGKAAVTLGKAAHDTSDQTINGNELRADGATIPTKYNQIPAFQAAFTIGKSLNIKAKDDLANQPVTMKFVGKNSRGETYDGTVEIGESQLELIVAMAAHRYATTVNQVGFDKSQAIEAAKGEISSYIDNLKNVRNGGDMALFDVTLLEHLKQNMQQAALVIGRAAGDSSDSRITTRALQNPEFGALDSFKGNDTALDNALSAISSLKKTAKNSLVPHAEIQKFRPTFRGPQGK